MSFDVNKIINESLKETIDSDPPETDETKTITESEEVDEGVVGEEEGVVTEAQYKEAKDGIAAFLESVDDGKKE